MSGTVLPTITHVGASPIYGSGGGGGGSGISSFQQVYTSSFVASTITIAGQSQFNKAVSMSDKLSVTLPITAQSGMFSSTFTLPAVAAGTSSIIFSTSNTGVYITHGQGDTGVVNIIGRCASMDGVFSKVLSGNTYCVTANLAATSGNSAITTDQPVIGQPGPIDFYYCNNSANTVAVTGSITRIGGLP